MKLRNDDDVHRYQRIFIDFRGWNVGEFVKARYVSWGCWAVIAGILFITVGARFGGALVGGIYCAVIAAVATHFAAPHLSNETGPAAWAQAWLSEYRAWRAAQARARRLAAPVERWTAPKDHA